MATETLIRTIGSDHSVQQRPSLPKNESDTMWASVTPAASPLSRAGSKNGTSSQSASPSDRLSDKNDKKVTQVKRRIFEAMDEVDKQAELAEMSTTSGVKTSLRYRAIEITRHRRFTFFIGGVIAMNAIQIGVETNHRQNSDADHWVIIEIIFALIFFVELVLRLFAERSKFFKDGWNIFDLVLVACSCLDTFVLAFVDAGNGTMNIISILRIMRLVRLARIFRLLRFFKELWLLVSGIAGAIRTLVWAFLLMAVIIYVCAILFTRTIGQPYADEDPEIDMYFGSIDVSMFTLFQVLTLEAWADICRCAMKHEPWVWIFFLLYLSLTTYAIMNIVIAVIVDNTAEQAMKQKQDLHKKEEEEKRQAAQKISEIFLAADADKNGEVTKEEFLSAMEQEQVQRYLQQIGIDIRQAENLFDILDYDESGSLDAQEFSTGVMKARGEAKARDLLTVQCDLWRYEQKFRKDLYGLCESLHTKCSSVDEEVAHIRDDLLRILGCDPGAATNGQQLSEHGIIKN